MLEHRSSDEPTIWRDSARADITLQPRHPTTFYLSHALRVSKLFGSGLLATRRDTATLMASIAPVTKPIARAALRSKPANGHVAFVPQIRKLVFEYCDVRHSSGPLREFLLKDVESLATKNPHVEIVVRQRPQRQPIVRGFYSECRPSIRA